MKKLFVFLPLCLLVLVSCNFSSSQTPIISANEVNTHVAETIQSIPTTTFITATPIPTTALVTATATLKPSDTPTATANPEDPRLTLGTPTFTENFSSGSSFGLKTPYTDDAITMSVSGGEMLMQSSRLQSGIHWRLAYLTPRNFYLEGKFKTVDCTGSDYYGLVARSPDYTNGIGYYFGISCSGQYSLMRFDTSDLLPLVDWTTDSTILAGSNQENRIGMMLSDDQISLYINGKLIKKVSNNALSQKGYFGVFQAAVQNPALTVAVEQIDEWDQP